MYLKMALFWELSELCLAKLQWKYFQCVCTWHGLGQLDIYTVCSDGRGGWRISEIKETISQKHQILCSYQLNFPNITGISLRTKLYPRSEVVTLFPLSVQNICLLCLVLVCQSKKYRTYKQRIKLYNSECCLLSLCPSRPVLNVLADSDEESSSAASSDEDEPPGLSEPQGPVGDKGTTPPADGYVLVVPNNLLFAFDCLVSCSWISGKISLDSLAGTGWWERLSLNCSRLSISTTRV